MSLYQYKGRRYPRLIVSSNDFIIPPGESQFVRIAIKAISEWEAVYVTPALNTCAGNDLSGRYHVWQPDLRTRKQ